MFLCPFLFGVYLVDFVLLYNGCFVCWLDYVSA